MKLRRLMPIARRRQSLPKASVVRHSKIAPPMSLVGQTLLSRLSLRAPGVRRSPKADIDRIIKGVPDPPNAANDSCCRLCRRHSPFQALRNRARRRSLFRNPIAQSRTSSVRSGTTKRSATMPTNRASSCACSASNPGSLSRTSARVAVTTSYGSRRSSDPRAASSQKTSYPNL